MAVHGATLLATSESQYSGILWGFCRVQSADVYFSPLFVSSLHPPPGGFILQLTKSSTSTLTHMAWQINKWAPTPPFFPFLFDVKDKAIFPFSPRPSVIVAESSPSIPLQPSAGGRDGGWRRPSCHLDGWRTPFPRSFQWSFFISSH